MWPPRRKGPSAASCRARPRPRCRGLVSAGGFGWARANTHPPPPRGDGAPPSPRPPNRALRGETPPLVQREHQAIERIGKSALDLIRLNSAGLDQGLVAPPDGFTHHLILVRTAGKTRGTAIRPGKPAGRLSGRGPE